jgi:hypothetical protein
MNRNRDRCAVRGNTQRIIFLWGSVLILAALLLSATEAFANHNVCTIRAGDKEVWVRVFDVDRDGNIKRGYGSSPFFSREVLFDGILARGEKSEVRSSTGQVRYDYKASSDYRAYGNNTATCSHGEVIVVP